MSVIKGLVNYLKKFVYKERSAQKLALSFCIGNYIAFSPFLGLHTVMVFIAVWLFQLNFPITLAVAYAVNNIWTAVPIYTLDYAFGYWLVHKVMRIKMLTYSPSWMAFINNFFELKLGLAKPCLWSFLIGGNLLGILTSLMFYPIVKKLFAKLTFEIHGTTVS